MRLETLAALRCMSCGAGSLVPDEAHKGRALIFGPVSCLGCQARFPVSEGLIDFVGDAEPNGTLLHEALTSDVAARAFNGLLRPAVDTLLGLGKSDFEREYVIARSLLGRPNGVLADVGCGPATYLRRYAADGLADSLVGVDVSRPMLEEAIALMREDARQADFVRALVPPLPFLNHSVGAISAIGFLHFVVDAPGFFAEAARVLKPGGCLVLTTYDAPKLAKVAQQGLGLTPRSDEELRLLAQAAGLIRFERHEAGATMVVKVEQP